MEAFTDSQVIVNGKGLLRLLAYDQWQDEWSSKINELGIQIDHGPDSPHLLGIVLDLLDFPKDSGDDEEGFCRDYLWCSPEAWDKRDEGPQAYLDWLFQQKKELFPD